MREQLRPYVLFLVCVPLHHFLGAAFPEQYLDRERENKELEAKQGVQSPEIPRGPALDSDPAILASAATDWPAGPPASEGTPDDGPASSYICSNPSCRQLAFQPSVLSCGCLVCKACVPRPAPGPGDPAGEQKTEAWTVCPSCELAALPDPRVCMKLEDALRCLYPAQYMEREKEAAAVAAAAAAAAAGAAAVGGGLNVDSGPSTSGSGSGRPSVEKPEGAAGARHEQPGSNGGARARPRSKLPRIDALIAAAAADSGPAAAVAAPSIIDIWAALREELAANSDACFAWYSVGCDDCGVFPIVGRRYRCQDCSEAIGYDLCGACYDRGMAGRGRFNQAHRPEHRMQKVEPCFGSSGRSLVPPPGGANSDRLGIEGVQVVTLMNYLEVLHPELTVEQATSLVIGHLGGSGLAFLDSWGLGALMAGAERHGTEGQDGGGAAGASGAGAAAATRGDASTSAAAQAAGGAAHGAVPAASSGSGRRRSGLGWGWFCELRRGGNAASRQDGFSSVHSTSRLDPATRRGASGTEQQQQQRPADGEVSPGVAASRTVGSRRRSSGTGNTNAGSSSGGGGGSSRSSGCCVQ